VNKPVAMLDQQYLLDLISNKIEENINLDFKGAGSLQRTDKCTNELSKDVSAFANSAGGVIIYGIKEDGINRHLPIEIEPIDRKVISKEWIEQIIQGNIQPRLENIIITPIEIDGDVNKVVYLIEIPKSSTAHQANDRKYYKRFNFNSEPMYDYEIRDILNRSKNPVIAIYFKIFGSYQDEFQHVLKVFAKNNGSVLAKYVNCYIRIHQDCFDEEHDPMLGDIIELLGTNTVRERTGEVIHVPRQSPRHIYGPSRYNPLLPRMSSKLSFSDIELSRNYKKHSIKWTVFADNADPAHGFANLGDIEVIYV
jgi:hypothetical protein